MDKFPSEQYCSMLGRCTISWAVFERSLDMLIAISFHNMGGAERHKEIPRSFKRKTAYLRDMAKRDGLAEYQDVLLPLLSGADENADERNDIIHGIADTTLECGGVKLDLLKAEPQIHRVSEREVGIESLISLTEKVVAHSAIAVDIGTELVKRYVNVPDNAGS